jgi:glycosyltransferase involved in cell wall biosynthesis
VWPHRWEHDKGPDELLALAETHTETLNLRWTILGQQFRETPQALERFRQRFADRIDHVGYAESRDDYWQRVAACDWVLSTADHEFFGIAVVEALLAGCLPWLPERLSYTELLPPKARGLSPAHPPDDPDAVRAAIRAHLEPALATNAVQRLDEAIASIVESVHEAADAGPSNSGS